MTLSIKLFSKINGGELFRHFLEKIISFDLLALNVTFRLVAQAESVEMDHILKFMFIIREINMLLKPELN